MFCALGRKLHKNIFFHLLVFGRKIHCGKENWSAAFRVPKSEKKQNSRANWSWPLVVINWWNVSACNSRNAMFINLWRAFRERSDNSNRLIKKTFEYSEPSSLGARGNYRLGAFNWRYSHSSSIRLINDEANSGGKLLHQAMFLVSFLSRGSGEL